MKKNTLKTLSIYAALMLLFITVTGVTTAQNQHVQEKVIKTGNLTLNKSMKISNISHDNKKPRQMIITEETVRNLFHDLNIQSNQTLTVRCNGDACIYNVSEFSHPIIPASTNQWVALAYSQFSGAEYWGQWKVPSAPPVNNGQSIMYFIALEDTSSFIVQPVIQWNDYSAFGQWEMISEAGTGTDSSGYVRSDPMIIHAGDMIYGDIWNTDKNNWMITTYDAIDISTSLVVYMDQLENNFQGFKYAYATLEGAPIPGNSLDCDQIPSIIGFTELGVDYGKLSFNKYANTSICNTLSVWVSNDNTEVYIYKYK